MLLRMGQDWSRHVVVAYDIGCPRRAYRVRKQLASLHLGRQYSVYELCLPDPALHGLVAELATECDLSEDGLAVWWPSQGMRVVQHGTRQSLCDLRDLSAHAIPNPGLGDFVVCYDIGDPESLRSVAALIGSAGAMLQRSIYWLRMAWPDLSRLLQRCGPLLKETDLLWAYPLSGTCSLWRLGISDSALLPLSTHRFQQSGGDAK